MGRGSIYHGKQYQNFKPLVWFHYMDDIFLIWTHGEESLQNFITGFNLFSDDVMTLNLLMNIIKTPVHF